MVEYTTIAHLGVDDKNLWRTWLARLFGLACMALGVIGLGVGFSGLTWKLGVVGWFTGALGAPMASNINARR